MPTMKYLSSLLVAAAPALALPGKPAPPPDRQTSDLCPASDNTNLTDTAGNSWAVSCGYALQAQDVDQLGGDDNLDTCLEACNEAGCYGVNMDANGACYLASGNHDGVKSESGYTNLVRLTPSTASPNPPSSSTSNIHVSITSTIVGPGLTLAPAAYTTTGQQAASSLTASSAADTPGQCTVNLELEDLCPTCNGLISTDSTGAQYLVLCDTDLNSNNGTYSLQERASPAECLAQCEDVPFTCYGAIYYDYADCEIAKGVVSSVSRSGFTAFIPQTTAAAADFPSAATTTRASGDSPIAASTPTSSADPTFSILPIPSACDQSALNCPACGGVAVADKLNSSYTVLCAEPVCEDTVVWQDGASSQESCMEGCDQDATCVAAIYHPHPQACHLCQGGVEQGSGSSNSSFVVLVVDMDRQEDPVSTASAAATGSSNPAAGHDKIVISGYNPRGLIINITSTSAEVSVSGFTPGGAIINLTTPTAEPNTAFNPGGPIPNPTTPTPPPNTDFNPGGPLIPLSKLSSSSDVAIAAFNPGGPLIPASSAPTSTASVINISNVTCPNHENDVYIDPTTGEYFDVMCDATFEAAHSRFLSASDLPGCIASCTGQCHGVRFGYSTRCGLYTDISTTVSATGWTVAASITMGVRGIATATAAVTTAPVVVASGASLPKSPNAAALGSYGN